MSDSTDPTGYDADKFMAWLPIYFLFHPKRMMTEPAKADGPKGEGCILLFTDPDLAETYRDSKNDLQTFLVANASDAALFLEALDIFEKGKLTHAIIDFDGKRPGRLYAISEIREAAERLKAQGA